MDRAPVHSSEAWHRYEPETSFQDDLDQGPVELNHVVLLTPEPEIAERLEIKELGNFTRALHQVVQELFLAVTPDQAQALVVEVQIQPAGTIGIRLSSHPGLPRTLLDHLRLELMGMQAPSIRDGSVAFEAHFLIWADSMTLH